MSVHIFYLPEILAFETFEAIASLRVQFPGTSLVSSLSGNWTSPKNVEQIDDRLERPVRALVGRAEKALGWKAQRVQAWTVAVPMGAHVPSHDHGLADAAVAGWLTLGGEFVLEDYPIVISPFPGLCAVFPGDATHRVEVSRIQRDRLSLSVNLWRIP